MIILSDAERRKFALWLKQDAEFNRVLTEQLSKIPHSAPVVTQKKRDIAACLIVASMLEDGETQTISAD